MGMFKRPFQSAAPSEITPDAATTPLLHSQADDVNTQHDDQHALQGMEVPAPPNGGQTPAADPQDWQGLPVWLATEDPKKVEATLISIRDNFMKANHSRHPDQATSSSSGSGSGSSGSQHGQPVAAAAERHQVKPMIEQAVLRETVMYGEMVQAVYDTLLTKDVYSPYFGNCVKDVIEPGKSLGGKSPSDKVGIYTQLGEAAKKYKVLAKIEADSGAYKLVIKEARNYVGFIAEGPEDPITGAVDIAIVFRGTVTDGDWLQDAKALRVRWRGGEQPAAPPSVFLTASPFYVNFSVVLATSIATFVILSSEHTSSILEAMGRGLWSLGSWCVGLGQPLATLCLPFTTFAWALTGAFALAIKPFMFLFERIIKADREEVNPQLLAEAAVVGLMAFVVWGILSALIDKPGQWGSNALKLLKAVPQWVSHALYIFIIDPCVPPWSDPKVSYGFKEMYCDSLPYKSTDDDKDKDKGRDMEKGESKGKDKDKGEDKSEDKDKGEGEGKGKGGDMEKGKSKGKGEPLPSPRQTVYTTLADLLDDGKKIKSITITGHSLGGALASMCGFDLSTAIQEAHGKESVATAGARYSSPFVKGFKPSLLHRFFNFTSTIMDSLHHQGMTKLKALYQGAHKERMRFQKLLNEKDQNPVVAVVTFAAPRVGNLDYTKALGPRTVMSPWVVREPFNGGCLNRVAVAIRDCFWQGMKMPWYVVALLQRVFVQQPSKVTTPAERSATPGTGRDVRVGMLRLVNTHDIVPTLPFTLPLPFVFYVHGGYELLLNSYLVRYFKNTWLGPSVVARHSLEVYLHLLDNTRDIALVNKSASVLKNDKEPKIPDAWWDPVPHKGLEKTPSGKWRRNDALVQCSTPPPSLPG